MILKILLALIFAIIYEIINLVGIGIIDNPIAFGFLKILIMITLIISIVSINAFNLRLIRRMKKIIPSIIETAEKVLMTLINAQKKEWLIRIKFIILIL